VVLADASTLLQRLRAGGMHVRLALAVLDGVGDGEHDLMQRLDQVVLALLPEARGMRGT
jgi:hypothetical protein